MDYDDKLTKGERRDSKRKKRRKMAVSGTGVRVLQSIILDKAK